MSATQNEVSSFTNNILDNVIKTVCRFQTLKLFMLRAKFYKLISLELWSNSPTGFHIFLTAAVISRVKTQNPEHIHNELFSLCD